MPPQPFKGGWELKPNVIQLRPKLAEHVGIIASKWANVEANLGMMLSLILMTDAELGTEMYLAIISEQAKDAALRAAAKLKLDSDTFSKFDQLLKRLKSPRKMRNAVVHGFWALPKDNSESIVLMDSGKYVKWLAAMFGNNIDLAGAKRWGPALNDLQEAALEYKESDFIEIENEIDAALRDIGSFLSLIILKYSQPQIGIDSPQVLPQ